MKIEQINQFTKTYLGLYESADTIPDEVEETFEETCLSLGFENDWGQKLKEQSGGVNPFKNAQTLEMVIHEINDPKILGDAIYSMWKKIMLYQEHGYLLTDESRRWFTTALNRLRLITERINPAKGEMVLSPAYEKLAQEIKKLRKELAVLLLEKDDLLFTTCVNLENAYLIRFGKLENQIYKYQIIASRLARKIELIQIKRNRQASVDLAELDEILDEEFKEKMKVLQQKDKRRKEAERFKDVEAMSQKDFKNMKRLYYEIVKQLHPDLHPHLTESEKRLFNSAVLAYKAGDLRTIEIIHMAMKKPEQDMSGKTGFEVLKEERDYLLGRIDEIKFDIREIMSFFPYTANELLNDERKAREKEEKLQYRIDQLSQKIRRLEIRIARMMREEDE